METNNEINITTGTSQETLPTFPPAQPMQSENERRDAAEHRQHILATARKLFAKHGVDAVSMHQIARAAGVGQGTLYRRYAHKGLLCFALLDESKFHFQNRLLAYMEQEIKTTSALELIFYLLNELMLYNEENGPLLGAAIDAAQKERRADIFHSPFYLWLREIVMVLLRHAERHKEISVSDIEYTTDFILRSLAVDFYLYQRDSCHFSRERIASALRQLLLHGLRANIET